MVILLRVVVVVQNTLTYLLDVCDHLQDVQVWKFVKLL